MRPPLLANMRKIKDCIKSLNLEVFDYLDHDDFSIVKLEELGFEYPFQSHTFRPAFFQINIMTQANSFFEVGAESFHLTSNWVLLLKPEVYISCQHLKPDTTGYHITFNANFLSKYSHISIKSFSPVSGTSAIALSLSPVQMKIIEETCLNLYNEATSHSDIKNELIGNILTLLLFQLQKFKNDRIPGFTAMANDAQDDDIQTTFFLHLEKNFSDLALERSGRILRTKDYADLQNIDKSYLSKHISHTTGKTINFWIKKKTIDEIKYLLKNSKKPLKEISYIYGFYELNYFYSYFKKHTGISPYNYRKMWQRYFPYKYSELILFVLTSGVQQFQFIT